MKTILITGASSGIGEAIARYFAGKGWNVAATMRSPEKHRGLCDIKNIRCYRLDVTVPETIQETLERVMKDFGGLDVVVNNAGYAAVGIFEKATPEQIQQQFDVNVFGPMNVIREVLPYFRKKGEGIIINITSMGGLLTFPLYSVYHGTKWAMEGFGESLHHELRHLNIRVKNVEPGVIKTDFYHRSQELLSKPGLTDYDRYEKVLFENTQQAGADAPGPEVVAKAVWKAANDSSFRLRYPAGIQASWIIPLRKLLPFRLFNKIVRTQVEKGL